jgi:chemotaxis protein methyltransferase CheR
MTPPPFSLIDGDASGPTLDRGLYVLFRTLIYERSGISLGPHKEALVTSRLSKRMRQLGITNYRSYYRHVVNDSSGVETTHLLDAISTNVTSFYREPAHFDAFADCVRGWHAAGQRRFRFWSAACSTGEEPYSMSMALHEEFPGTPLDVRILATDISTRALELAEAGVYAAGKTETLPRWIRERYFSRQPDGDRLAIVPKVRDQVAFRRLNLSTIPFPMHGPFDAVFCRNVMIYFDNIVRKRLLTEIERLLRPGGTMFVGHAESLTGMLGNFVSVGPARYMKRKS